MFGTVSGRGPPVEEKQPPTTSIMTCFSVIMDPRIERNKLYPLHEVIVITILAVSALGACGILVNFCIFMQKFRLTWLLWAKPHKLLAQGWEDIERYARAKKAWLRRFLKLENGLPHHDVYRRVMIRLDPGEIEGCFMNWVRAIKREYTREIAD
jgi:hypothetical protein